MYNVAIIRYPVYNVESDFEWSDAPNYATVPPNERNRKPLTRCEKVTKVVSQNTNGWKVAWKVEATIENMIRHNIDAYLIQETWQTDNW